MTRRYTPAVALLTERMFLVDRSDDWYVRQTFAEDGIVIDALARLGIPTTRVEWSDPSVDWVGFRAALFRTTWDYFHRFAEFTAWLDRVSPLARLFNDAALVRWNMDKRYLADLGRAGCRVVPTVYIERGDVRPLARVVAESGFAETGAPEFILKPVFSGCARHTYRFAVDEAAALEPTFRGLVAGEAMMLQPFLPSVLDSGETSLVMLDGEISHAVRKVPKAGDFRVQDDFGGAVHPHEAAPAERDLARRAVAACPGDALYARVDFVADAAGDPAIMELELIEPELFFRFAPGAADRLAAGVARRLGA